jgi:hypothetical protein
MSIFTYHVREKFLENMQYFFLGRKLKGLYNVQPSLPHTASRDIELFFSQGL